MTIAAASSRSLMEGLMRQKSLLQVCHKKSGHKQLHIPISWVGGVGGSHAAANDPEGQQHQPKHQPGAQQPSKHSCGWKVQASIVQQLGPLQKHITGIVQQHDQRTHSRIPAASNIMASLSIQDICHAAVSMMQPRASTEPETTAVCLVGSLKQGPSCPHLCRLSQCENA